MDEYTIGVLPLLSIKLWTSLLNTQRPTPAKSQGGSGSGTEDEVCTGLIELYCGVDLNILCMTLRKL